MPTADPRGAATRATTRDTSGPAKDGREPDSAAHGASPDGAVGEHPAHGSARTGPGGIPGLATHANVLDAVSDEEPAGGSYGAPPSVVRGSGRGGTSPGGVVRDARGQAAAYAGSGELHAVVLPTGPELFAAVTDALNGDGPALLPIDPALPAARRDALLAAMRPHAIRTVDGVRRLPGPAAVMNDTALVIATSGSTGTPKGVELSRHALTASARATLDRIGAAPGDRWLCCLPTSHIAGLQVLTRSVVAGTEPVLHERFDPAAVTATGAAHVSLVPTMLRRLLDRGADLTVFATIVLGGAPAAPGLLDEARAAGARVVTTYGMSETCGGCVYDGVPLDGMRAELRDVETDGPVPPDGVGRIVLGGPALFTGYRLDPDLTAATRDGGRFRTSDLGRYDGGRLHVLGRVDDVINTGGEKVVAGEVARELSAHPAVADVVVVGRADREWGQRVTAVVVPADPAAPPTLADLRAYARERLPAAAAPRELDLVPEIPLLPSGKPDRAALIGA